MVGRPEIVTNLDLADDPAISAELTIAYIADQYKGGGFDKLMRAVGQSTTEMAAQDPHLQSIHDGASLRLRP
jgi:hypothetical protein